MSPAVEPAAISSPAYSCAEFETSASLTNQTNSFARLVHEGFFCSWAVSPPLAAGPPRGRRPSTSSGPARSRGLSLRPGSRNRLNGLQASSLPRPAFAVWLLKERSSPRKEKSGSGAHGRSLSNFNTWRSFRAPPVFLPWRRTGPLPLVSVKARTWGFITQQRTVFAASPAPPPSPSIRFMTRVPARAMGQVSPREIGVEKRSAILLKKSAAIFPCGSFDSWGESNFNSLAGSEADG